MFHIPMDGFEDDDMRTPSPPLDFEEMKMKRRGSDAFQAVLKQFDFSDEECFSGFDTIQLNSLDGISRKQLEKKRDKTEENEEDMCGRAPGDGDGSSGCSLDSENGKYFKQQKHNEHHVQWVDECYVLPIAYEPNECEKHTGRIFVKTVPSKSILKHY